MALEIKWSKKAMNDFELIQMYLQATWGDSSVKKFTRKVFNTLDLLAEFPKLGTIEREELGIRGLVIVKQLTVFYQIRSKEIILLRFYDNRQEPKNRKYE